MPETAAPPWFVDAFDAMVVELGVHPRVQITHQSPRRRFPKTGKGTFASWLATKKKEPKPLRETLAALGGFGATVTNVDASIPASCGSVTHFRIGSQPKAMRSTTTESASG